MLSNKLALPAQFAADVDPRALVLSYTMIIRVAYFQPF